MSSLFGVYVRWLFGNSLGWNYEQYQGLGYCFAILPELKRIYGDDVDGLHESIGVHLMFFNSNATTASLILGAGLAIEQSGGLELHRSLKLGLMGALGGVGDTLFVVLPTTVIAATASYLALDGVWYGLVLIFGFYMFKNVLMYYLLVIGYRKGTLLISSVGDKVKRLTDSANVLGVMVVGGLVASVVKVSTPLVLFESDVGIQKVLDLILPSFLACVVVWFTYYLLGVRFLNSSRVIFILLVCGVLLGMFGVLS